MSNFCSIKFFHPSIPFVSRIPHRWKWLPVPNCIFIIGLRKSFRVRVINRLFAFESQFVFFVLNYELILVANDTKHIGKRFQYMKPPLTGNIFAELPLTIRNDISSGTARFNNGTTKASMKIHRIPSNNRQHYRTIPRNCNKTE